MKESVRHVLQNRRVAARVHRSTLDAEARRLRDQLAEVEREIAEAEALIADIGEHLGQGDEPLSAA